MFGAATAGVSGREQGIASGMASTARQVGGAVGLAVLVGLAGLGERASASATVDGMRTGLLAATAGIALTAVVALGFPRRAGR
ncbi:hypothetical protein [Streptomyces sp. MJP52]|uniref:hypothetical protein n=1 Tax=Streptomyces sp. MJP52 TaxID=2940555 RepID=UPI0024738A24|nr:hypothetical protein [Streptomyces sp. MJP52]MDH6224554.1 chromate transport protein ChrA [Streptomyces sp. MJP52]